MPDTKLNALVDELIDVSIKFPFDCNLHAKSKHRLLDYIEMEYRVDSWDEGHDFSWALTQMKYGKKVYRPSGFDPGGYLFVTEDDINYVFKSWCPVGNRVCNHDIESDDVFAERVAALEWQPAL